MLHISSLDLILCWFCAMAAFVAWGFAVSEVKKSHPERIRKGLAALAASGAVAFTLYAFLFLVRLAAQVWRAT